MPILSPAFVAGLKAGLATPIALYSPTPTYTVDAYAYSPAKAFAAAGALLRTASQEIKR